MRTLLIYFLNAWVRQCPGLPSISLTAHAAVGRGTDSLAVRRCWLSFKKPGSLTQTIKHKTINIHFGIYFQQKPHQSKRPLLGSVWGPGAAPGLAAMGRAGREERLFLRGSARRTWPQALPERLQQEASFLCCPLPLSFPQSSSSLAWPPAPTVPSTLCSSLVLRQLRDLGPGLCPWGCCFPVGLLLPRGASAVLWGAAAPWGCWEPWLGLWQQHAARSTQHAAHSGRALLACCLLRRSFGAPGKARRCEHQGQICTMQRQSVAFRL